jgi:hypothetical protein
VADLILRAESNSELDGIHHLQQLAVKGVGSAHSRRAYAAAIEEFVGLHNGKIRINASQLRAYQAHLAERTPHRNKDNDTPRWPTSASTDDRAHHPDCA